VTMPTSWGPDGDRTIAVPRGAIGWGIAALETAIALSQGLRTLGVGTGLAQEQGIGQMELAHTQLRAAFDGSAH
jgi:hypothetical protein